MKSLILTVLYLAKDTLNRWKTRLSSPLARVLVVFFLSMCSLCFMANYVLSTKAVFNDIAQEGADTARITTLSAGQKRLSMPDDIPFLEKEFDCDALVLRGAGLSVKVRSNIYPVMCYGIPEIARIASLLPERGNAVLVLPKDEQADLGEAPVTVSAGNFTFDLPCRRMPDDHLLAKAYPRGVVLVDAASPLVRDQGSSLFILKQKTMSYEGMKRIEEYFRDYFRLEHVTPMMFTYSRVLRKMEIVLGNQAQCRAGFSIGIAVIVGILLTALASMEYRQNEYIYTLMKSFGIRPVMLVGAFIVENLLLVGISLAAAVQFFMIAQVVVLREFFKLRDIRLTLEEILPDVYLLGAALVVCVFVSAIPIVCAVRREIGRVLQ